MNFGTPRRTGLRHKSSFLYDIFVIIDFIPCIPHLHARNHAGQARLEPRKNKGSIVQDKNKTGHSKPQGDEDNEISAVLDRNINALIERRTMDRRTLSREEQAAAAITGFAGSMTFVYIHVAVFGLWIVVNLQWLPFWPAFDPSLVILAMIASVEAIFISTFVLISQNRMAAEEDKRAELSLQISLLNEHETTRLIAMVSAIASKFEINTGVPRRELEEMKKDVPPEVVLAEIERQKPG